MALAYGNFHELSHQLRFLLFEIGIGLPQSNIDYFITLAHKNTLRRLQHAALAEGLINSPIASHHIHDFVDQLQMKLKEADPSSHFFQWNSLRDELDESVANEALTYAYKQRWNIQLRNEVSPHGCFWEWIKNEHTTNQALLFLEQWGDGGEQAYYPGFFAKIGYTRREVLQNSAEFQSRINLHWCSLNRKHFMSSAECEEFSSFVAREFPNEFKLWQEKLLVNHVNPHEYIPIPVHPWQWRNGLQRMCSSLLDDKSLILLPHHQTVMPSLADDLMMPINHSNCRIKLAVAIPSAYPSWNDQTERAQYHDVIQPWLNSLLIQSDHFQHTLYLTDKLTRFSVNSSTIPLQIQQQLSVNFIENPAFVVKADHLVIPLAGLFTKSPGSNKPLLIEIINSSGLMPIDYFRLYCQKVLFSQLQLLLKFGVAFDIKPHKTLVFFDDDRPQGLIIRDLEKVKIADSEYFKTRSKPQFPANSKFAFSTLDALGTAFIQGTLQNNLGRWVDALSQEYQLDAQHLWHIVYQFLQNSFIELRNEVHPGILCWVEHQLVQEQWKHLCSLTMRLKAGTNMNLYRISPNQFNNHVKPE